MLKFIFVPMFILGSCFSTNKEKKVTQIEIRSVDFDLTSFFKIDCESFEKSFEDEFQTAIISSKEEFDIFEAVLKKLIKDREKYLPDVRAKIFIRYESDTDTLCLSNLGILYNGDSFEASPELVDLVEKYRK